MQPPVNLVIRQDAGPWWLSAMLLPHRPLLHRQTPPATGQLPDSAEGLAEQLTKSWEGTHRPSSTSWISQQAGAGHTGEVSHLLQGELAQLRQRPLGREELQGWLDSLT